MPPRLPPRSASFAALELGVTSTSCSGDPPKCTDDPGAPELSSTSAATYPAGESTGWLGATLSRTTEAVVSVLAACPRIPESLTQWTGLTIAAPQSLGDQNRAGLRAIDAITEELGEAP